MELREYQNAAVMFLANHRRAILKAPAGSGKTIIAAAALERVIQAVKRERKCRVGWLVNTQEQMQQGLEAIAKFPVIAEKSEVNVACAAAQTDWSDRDVLVVDECHHSSAASWAAQIGSCDGARWGMSATPEAGDREILKQLFGESVHHVSRSSVSGNIASAWVVMLQANLPTTAEKIDRLTEILISNRQRFWRGSPDQLFQACRWQAVAQVGIHADHARTAAGIAEATAHISKGDSVLILINTVEHGLAIAAAIPDSVCVHSGIGKKKRRAALGGFKDGSIKCIVATSLADEGMDVPRAGVLILLSGGRSNRLAEQRTGRVLRTFAGKDEARIYDFTDAHHPTMASQSKARVRLYRQLGYKIE